MPRIIADNECSNQFLAPIACKAVWDFALSFQFCFSRRFFLGSSIFKSLFLWAFSISFRRRARATSVLENLSGHLGRYLQDIDRKPEAAKLPGKDEKEMKAPTAAQLFVSAQEKSNQGPRSCKFVEFRH
jgi:hypothetical protein